MPSEIKTPNIGLNQWQGNEYVKRQDFVDDNNKIDNEIGKIKKQMESISPDASSITYDNTTSELESDNVQDAIDEVNEKAKSALSKASANETSILQQGKDISAIQRELGINKETLIANTIEIFNSY